MNKKETIVDISVDIRWATPFNCNFREIESLSGTEVGGRKSQQFFTFVVVIDIWFGFF